MQSKKGAIELSMTTIIVIVLGVTLLILGLVFVRNIFGKTEQLGLKAFEQAEKQIQDKMGATDRISVSGGLTWTVEPGKPLPNAVGIQNFDENLESYADFKIVVESTDGKGKKEWFSFGQPGKIKAGTKVTVPIQVSLPAGLPPGSTFAFIIRVFKGAEEYSSQSILVSVKQ